MAIVAAGIVFTLIKITREIRGQDISLHAIRWGWLMLAVASYFCGMCFSWIYWHIAVGRLGVEGRYGKTFAAFFYSQLGKYVPGKAMVVVIRSAMVTRQNQKAATSLAVASVFLETLGWIAVGAAISSLLLGLIFPRIEFMVIAVVTMLVALLPTLPPLFLRLLRFVLRDRESLQAVENAIDLRLMLSGWGLLLIGWAFHGLSLWAVIHSVPGIDVSLSDYPLILLAASLATVVGFVSLIPGGLGARELVLIPILGSHFGNVPALLAAVLIRLVWIFTELMLVGIIFVTNGRSRKLARNRRNENHRESRSTATLTE